MAQVKLYFEDIVEGQEASPFERTTDLMNFNRFAAVNDEFSYRHMDDDFGRKRGEKGVVAMGNLRFSYLHNMLREWIGEAGHIRRVKCEYRGKHYKGDTLTCRGRVVKKYVQGGEHLVDLEVWVQNQKGETISPGEATVALPSLGSTY